MGWRLAVESVSAVLSMSSMAIQGGILANFHLGNLGVLEVADLAWAAAPPRLRQHLHLAAAAVPQVLPPFADAHSLGKVSVPQWCPMMSVSMVQAVSVLAVSMVVVP